MSSVYYKGQVFFPWGLSDEPYEDGNQCVWSERNIQLLYIQGDGGEEVPIHPDEIDSLIKALQEAKEWKTSTDSSQ